ncbi:MAG: TorF family putative porin [Rhodocyclaceae bacterium]|nr:TorF family putative porin [Rhodocyclaceae bacterium]
MRKTLISVAIASLSALPLLAHADAAPAAAAAAPAPAYTVTTNVNLVTDYYFRGISQTWHKPAIQGGADFTHTNGLYAGVWGSNVSNNTYPGGSALEFDYYGGYNGKINDDWGYTVGGHGYLYPGANYNKAATPGADQKFDSFEVNVGASWKFVSVKYSYFLTDWFGLNSKTYPGTFGATGNSKGTGYLEANVAYEFSPSWTLNLHAAQTKVKGVTVAAGDPSYNDYLVGVTKGFDGGWSVQLAYLKSTYKKDAFYKPTLSFANSDSLSDPGEGKLILTVGRTF